VICHKHITSHQRSQKFVEVSCYRVELFLHRAAPLHRKTSAKHSSARGEGAWNARGKRHQKDLKQPQKPVSRNMSRPLDLALHLFSCPLLPIHVDLRMSQSSLVGRLQCCCLLTKSQPVLDLMSRVQVCLLGSFLSATNLAPSTQHIGFHKHGTRDSVQGRGHARWHLSQTHTFISCERFFRQVVGCRCWCRVRKAGSMQGHRSAECRYRSWS
jgi:hypothetical protein